MRARLHIFVIVVISVLVREASSTHNAAIPSKEPVEKSAEQPLPDISVGQNSVQRPRTGFLQDDPSRKLHLEKYLDYARWNRDKASALAKAHKGYAAKHLVDSIAVPGAFCAAYLSGLAGTPRRLADHVRNGDAFGVIDEVVNICSRLCGLPFRIVRHTCGHSCHAYKRLSDCRQHSVKAKKYDDMCYVLLGVINAAAIGEEGGARALCARVNQLEAEIRGYKPILPTQLYSQELGPVDEPAWAHNAASTDSDSDSDTHHRAQIVMSDADLRAAGAAWRKSHISSKIAVDRIYGGPGATENPRRLRLSPFAHRLMDAPQDVVDIIIGDTMPRITPHPASGSLAPAQDRSLRPDDD